MTADHDPLCSGTVVRRETDAIYVDVSVTWPCACDFIRKVRADERDRWSPPQPVTPGHVPGLCWCPSCHTAHDAATRSTA